MWSLAARSGWRQQVAVMRPSITATFIPATANVSAVRFVKSVTPNRAGRARSSLTAKAGGYLVSIKGNTTFEYRGGEGNRDQPPSGCRVRS